LRKFINPQKTRIIWKSLGDEHELSEQLKILVILQKKPEKIILWKFFIKINQLLYSNPFQLQNKNPLLNNEIKFKIESLLEQMSRSVQQKYCGFKSKNKNDLLNMLQEIKCLFNEENEIDNSDLLENQAE